MDDAVTLPMLISEKAMMQPVFPVLTIEHDGTEQVRTYLQLWDNALRLAAALQEFGVGAGDRVAIVMENHPEFVESMIAAGILGAIFVPIDPDSSAERIGHILRDSGCCGAVCECTAFAALTQGLKESDELRWLLVMGDAGAGAPEGLQVESLPAVYERPATDMTIVARNERDPMQIIYQSDMSGPAKGILVRHGRFIRLAKGGELVLGYRPSERLYTALPLTHSTAQFITLAPALKMGLKAVISRKFSKSRLWDVVRKYGCTTYSLLGGMATALYCVRPTSIDDDNPVRFVVSAGIPKALWKPFSERFKVQILEFYGITEGGLTIHPIGAGPVGSCGRVAPGHIARIVDEQDRDVPPNTTGEICFRPANRTEAVVEYYNNPLASAEKTRGGWLRTNDLVTMNEDGWVYFQCRKGSEISRGGQILDTSETLRRLAEHPDVDDVYLFGVPSAQRSDSEMVAAVVLIDGVTLDLPMVLEWCLKGLDPSLVPDSVMVLPTLPKSPAQKISEPQLLQYFREAVYPIYTVPSLRRHMEPTTC